MNDRTGQEGGRTSLAAGNLEAEAALIGAVLIDNEILESTLQIVSPDDFWEPLHQRVMHAIVRFRERGQIVTPVTLKPMFDRDEAMKELGGAAYLARLTGDGQGLLAPRELALQIAELARVREIIAGAQAAAVDYLDGEATLEQAIGPLEEALAKVGEAATVTPARSAADMIDAVEERAERITEHALGDIGVRTSTVSDFNSLLAPMEDGTYIVIGGRPSMGKTTLASSVAWGFAANGHPVLYAAAEGTEETLAMRFAADVSLESGMPLTHDQIRQDKLNREERSHFATLRERASTLPIEYQMVGRCDIRRLRSYVARACAKWRDRGDRLRVLVVDYMQLIGASHNGQEIDDDRRRINAVSKGLLGIAQDFGLVVIALSQLSRSLEARDDKRPRLSDLRESGRIEEDADVVLFVYREEYYLERTKPEPGRRDYEQSILDWESSLSRCRDRVDLILAKNRHGTVKTRTAKFYGKYTAIRGGDYADPPLDGGFAF